jgi:hypothetical protein
VARTTPDCGIEVHSTMGENGAAITATGIPVEDCLVHWLAVTCLQA